MSLKSKKDYSLKVLTTQDCLAKEVAGKTVETLKEHNLFIPNLKNAYDLKGISREEG